MISNPVFTFVVVVVVVVLQLTWENISVFTIELINDENVSLNTANISCHTNVCTEVIPVTTNSSSYVVIISTICDITSNKSISKSYKLLNATRLLVIM